MGAGILIAGVMMGISISCGGGGSGTSTPVDPPPPPPPATGEPKITTPPSNQTVDAPAPGVFSAAATGVPDPTFQWQVCLDGKNWNDVTGGSGGATPTYTTDATVSGSAACSYRVIAKNGIGTPAISEPVTLTVRTPPTTDTAPTITSAPVSLTVTAPATATFTAAASGHPTPTYQWEVSTNGTTWNNVLGATSASYTTAATVAGITHYRVVADNKVGTAATSEPATLTVNPAVPNPNAPAIKTQPVNQTVIAPMPATFRVVATGSPAPTYQWEVSTDGTTWANVTPGGTAATYTTVATVAGSTNHYRVIVSNTSGSPVTSTPATLTVTTAPPPPAGELSFNIPNGSGGTVNLLLEPIPAGSFTMGGPHAFSLPTQTVNIKAFHMAKFECTQAQWRAMMGNNPSQTHGDQNPVDSVSYDEIVAASTGFLAKLNAATVSTRPANTSFRLPTESEWEYACRAGSTTSFYFGGDDAIAHLSEYAWFYAGPSGVTPTGGSHPVGGLRPNAWGLYDMMGNVFESCQDYWHDERIGAPNDGSAWLVQDTAFSNWPAAEHQQPKPADRAARGGSWTTHEHYCHTYETGFLPTNQRDNDDGFRVVLAPTVP